MIKDIFLDVVKEVAVEATAGSDDDIAKAMLEVLNAFRICKRCQSFTLVGVGDFCTKCDKERIKEEIREKMGDICEPGN